MEDGALKHLRFDIFYEILVTEPVPKPLDKKLEILQGGQTDNCGH
jgi:hypothetical protein